MAAYLRTAIVVATPLVISACTSARQDDVSLLAVTKPMPDLGYAQMYSAIDDNGTLVPAVDVSKIEKRNLRQLVDYKTDQPVGTIVVEPHARFLYLVMEKGKAMRYGVGVAKAGLQFAGDADIARKAAWPRWTPTPNMIKREPPRYEKCAAGMEGGLKNPLGARALYLHQNGQDTLYRIHGTNEPWSIGKAVSSGCIRMFNQDIIDLNKRVPKGARTVVLGRANLSRQGGV